MTDVIVLRRSEPLTWEQYTSGMPCPSCGLPYLEKTRKAWRNKPLLELTPEEKVERDHEEDDFRRQHPHCHAGRHRVGDGPMHCLACCPPPPLDISQLAQIAQMLKPILKATTAR